MTEVRWAELKGDPSCGGINKCASADRATLPPVIISTSPLCSHWNMFGSELSRAAHVLSVTCGTPLVQIASR